MNIIKVVLSLAAIFFMAGKIAFFFTIIAIAMILSVKI